MIKYGDLVQYIKDNHVSWNTDLFDVLRGFFDKYSEPNIPSSPTQQEILFLSEEFKEPADREYSMDDTLKLFST